MSLSVILYDILYNYFGFCAEVSLWSYSELKLSFCFTSEQDSHWPRVLSSFLLNDLNYEFTVVLSRIELLELLRYGQVNLADSSSRLIIRMVNLGLRFSLADSDDLVVAEIETTGRACDLLSLI